MCHTEHRGPLSGLVTLANWPAPPASARTFGSSGGKLKGLFLSTLTYLPCIYLQIQFGQTIVWPIRLFFRQIDYGLKGCNEGDYNKRSNFVFLCKNHFLAIVWPVRLLFRQIDLGEKDVMKMTTTRGQISCFCIKNIFLCK